jgi:hypothetical protein
VELANPTRTKSLGEIVNGHVESPSLKEIPTRQVQVIRNFPNTLNHKTTVTVYRHAELWVSKDESPQIYMSLDRRDAWFKWMGTGAWELLTVSPEGNCVPATLEAAKKFVKGIYYDDVDECAYARDKNGVWKIFDEEGRWQLLDATDALFELVDSLRLIG